MSACAAENRHRMFGLGSILHLTQYNKCADICLWVNLMSKMVRPVQNIIERTIDRTTHTHI